MRRSLLPNNRLSLWVNKASNAKEHVRSNETEQLPHLARALLFGLFQERKKKGDSHSQGILFSAEGSPLKRMTQSSNEPSSLPITHYPLYIWLAAFHVERAGYDSWVLCSSGRMLQLGLGEVDDSQLKSCTFCH